MVQALWQLLREPSLELGVEQARQTAGASAMVSASVLSTNCDRRTTGGQPAATLARRHRLYATAQRIDRTHWLAMA